MKIVAIGGGEIGRPGYPVETTVIDKEILRLTGKKRPKLLLLPTASKDSDLYFTTAQKHFGKRLGCQVDVLNLLNKKTRPTLQQIERKILGADIIYVGGGNTLFMMGIWRKLGVDKLLIKAMQRDIVLSGVSAGAICWFRQGNSDSRKFKDKRAPLIKITGLGFIDAMACPHYDKELQRKPTLKNMMRRTPGVAIALDNCSALEVVEGKYRILTSNKSSNAYKVYRRGNAIIEERIRKTDEFQDIAELLRRD